MLDKRPEAAFALQALILDDLGKQSTDHTWYAPRHAHVRWQRWQLMTKMMGGGGARPHSRQVRTFAAVARLTDRRSTARAAVAELLPRLFGRDNDVLLVLLVLHQLAAIWPDLLADAAHPVPASTAWLEWPSEALWPWTLQTVGQRLYRLARDATFFAGVVDRNVVRPGRKPMCLARSTGVGVAPGAYYGRAFGLLRGCAGRSWSRCGRIAAGNARRRPRPTPPMP